MRAELRDIQWLRDNQPNLSAGIYSPTVVGILTISAYYDAAAERLVSAPRSLAGGHLTYVSDNFVVFISLADKDANGWPKVYDATARYCTIAKRYGIQEVDLHFYQDGRACLGLPHPDDEAFTLRSFVATMVEPFFYWLAYVDLYGIAAARRDLWGEYSHGKAGMLEHRRELRNHVPSASA